MFFLLRRSDDMYSIPMMDRSNPTMERYPLEGDDYPPRGPYLGSSFHQGSEGDYGLQPPERIQVEHLKVPEKYMGLIVGELKSCTSRVVGSRRK